MIDPSYTDITAKDIPCIEFNGGKATIIAGTFQGVTGPGRPHTGMLYHDIHLDKDSKFELDIARGWNAFIYIYEGNVKLGKAIYKGLLAVLELDAQFLDVQILVLVTIIPMLPMMMALVLLMLEWHVVMVVL